MNIERTRRSLNAGHARGFTLLEIIVVVTIIAILATLIAPKLLKNVDKAKVSSATQGVNTIAREINLWLLDNSSLTSLPDDFSLEKLTEGTDPSLKKSQLVDPWGHPYVIRIPGENSKFDVVSYGADGTEGGDGFNTDIISE